MSNMVGKVFSDFTAGAVMEDGRIKKDFKLSDYKGKYIVLFFFPLAFTFVCPTEIIAFNNRLKAFNSLEAVVLGVSIDSVYALKAWKDLPVEQAGIGEINFPLISDINKEITNSYDVMHEGGFSYRATFIIDKGGLIRHQHINDTPIGRDVDYILNVIESIQHVIEFGEVCPAGWKRGTVGMQPTQESVQNYLKLNSTRI